MKKRVTLTIDSGVYDRLQDLPRRVSISEVVSVLLDSMLEDLKRGHAMEGKELDEWVNSNPKRKAAREKLREVLGPTVYAVEDAIGKITGKTSSKANKSEKKAKK